MCQLFPRRTIDGWQPGDRPQMERGNLLATAVDWDLGFRVHSVGGFGRPCALETMNLNLITKSRKE